MTTVVDAPAEIVFLYLEDNERLKRWVPSLVEDEAIKETTEKIGSTFRQVFEERGKTMVMTGEITEYVENEVIRVDMIGDQFGLDVRYSLKPLGHARTEMTQDTEIKVKGFMKFIAPIFMALSKLKKNNAQAAAHSTLKEMAEQEYQSQMGN